MLPSSCALRVPHINCPHLCLTAPGAGALSSDISEREVQVDYQASRRVRLNLNLVSPHPRGKDSGSPPAVPTTVAGTMAHGTLTSTKRIFKNWKVFALETGTIPILALP